MIMAATTGLAREFTLTKVLDAPREAVFRAWTDPEHLGWFFSGREAPGQSVTVDLRPGGEWRQTMVLDDETSYVTGGIYREIVPGERLVFVWGATDGWPELAGDALDDGPLATVTLTDAGEGRTRMVFHLALPAHLPEERVLAALDTGMRDGWDQTLDRLVTRFARAATR
jgi:uncharacterized protein YndB with AHSA1/START domain